MKNRDEVAGVIAVIRGRSPEHAEAVDRLSGRLRSYGSGRVRWVWCSPDDEFEADVLQELRDYGLVVG